MAGPLIRHASWYSWTSIVLPLFAALPDLSKFKQIQHASCMLNVFMDEVFLGETSRYQCLEPLSTMNGWKFGQMAIQNLLER